MDTTTINVGDYLQQLGNRFLEADLFYGHGTNNARDEAVYLVFCTLDLDFDCHEEVYARVLTSGEIEKLNSLAHRRVEERIPVAYLVGKAWFAGHLFHINENCLVPRSPIAELIADCFNLTCPVQPSRVLDLCCGSGCIGISAGIALPGSAVDLADISGPALELANENIDLHNLGSRVQTVKSDLFQSINASYDLIICNPPYVSQSEIDQLPSEYSWEPVLGLLSAQNGLEIPSTILRQASSFLSPNGVLVMEVGHSAQALQESLPKVPFLWLDFEMGGEGVFVLTAKELKEYKQYF